ncbi:LINE-1 retrotransposable element orf2 protein [Plakobranchus ocellatus]|uniref:LINE-1 retrotransposable element orf2 protein n=1 Tax=Plakobranchus ocellatus TaxID=259542 RepID=A0AAV4AG33_9GAST|nr:LINE-1 retrotransposable element orf2 protein [Plakobranchus ocellatus]
MHQFCMFLSTCTCTSTSQTNTSLHTCFIDYSKAFDCVNHEKMWQTLHKMHFHPKIIRLVKSLYEGQQSAVQLEYGTTEWFPVTKGVRQGCILSPHLFSLYTEEIMRDVEFDPRKDEYDEPRLQ